MALPERITKADIWDPKEHPRWPKGTPGIGGQWRPKGLSPQAGEILQNIVNAVSESSLPQRTKAGFLKELNAGLRPVPKLPGDKGGEISPKTLQTIAEEVGSHWSIPIGKPWRGEPTVGDPAGTARVARGLGISRTAAHALREASASALPKGPDLYGPLDPRAPSGGGTKRQPIVGDILSAIRDKVTPSGSADATVSTLGGEQPGRFSPRGTVAMLPKAGGGWTRPKTDVGPAARAAGHPEIARLADALDATSKPSIGVHRRTFEAKNHPPGSPERKALNENAVTSEYMPSYKYTAVTPHPTTATGTTSRSFRTKREAEHHIDNDPSMFALEADDTGHILGLQNPGDPEPDPDMLDLEPGDSGVFGLQNPGEYERGDIVSVSGWGLARVRTENVDGTIELEAMKAGPKGSKLRRWSEPPGAVEPYTGPTEGTGSLRGLPPVWSRAVPAQDSGLPKPKGTASALPKGESFPDFLDRVGDDYDETVAIEYPHQDGSETGKDYHEMAQRLRGEPSTGPMAGQSNAEFADYLRMVARDHAASGKDATAEDYRNAAKKLKGKKDPAGVASALPSAPKPRVDHSVYAERLERDKRRSQEKALAELRAKEAKGGLTPAEAAQFNRIIDQQTAEQIHQERLASEGKGKGTASALPGGVKPGGWTKINIRPEKRFQRGVDATVSKKVFTYQPSPMDRILGGSSIEPGTKVRIVKLHGAPKPGTMGQYHVADPDTGKLLGMVSAASLTTEGRFDLPKGTASALPGTYHPPAHQPDDMPQAKVPLLRQIFLAPDQYRNWERERLAQLEAKGKRKGGVASALPQQDGPSAEDIHRHTLASGGLTYRLSTNSQPKTGYAFSPDKSTEKRIPIDKFTPADIERYVEAHSDALRKRGAHLGTWVNKDDGHVYLDVSHVGPSDESTIQRAREAKQLSVFDLSTGEEISTGYVPPTGAVAAALPGNLTPEGGGVLGGIVGGALSPRIPSETDTQDGLAAYIRRLQKKVRGGGGTGPDRVALDNAIGAYTIRYGPWVK